MIDGPYGDAEFTEDLHQLMAVAVLCGHRGVEADVLPVYEAWGLAYPSDALGGIGRGLSLVGTGKPREGYAMIEEAARSSTTRAEQAQEVLARLRADMGKLVE